MANSLRFAHFEGNAPPELTELKLNPFLMNAEMADN